MRKTGITSASKKLLSGKRIAVLGYGSQGKAQSLNLRDSGFTPVIGLPARSESRRKARLNRFEVFTPQKAIELADIIAVLAPDHKHKELFESLKPFSLVSGKALVFAHGMSVAFEAIKPPSGCDLVLVAPHGPGLRLREKYENGEPFTAFVGADKGSSRNAVEVARAYAEAIGCPREYQFKSTFRDEAVGDIFGEQAVLCGGLAGLMESGFELLIKKGFSAETAYLECIYQIDLLVDLVKKYGPAGMFERISATAAYGSLKNKKKLFDREFGKKLEKLYKEIKDGSFVSALYRENEKGMRGLGKLISESRSSKLQKAHDSISAGLKRRRRSSGRR